MATAAERYEKQYPGTGIPEAQKQERQERIDFKAEPAQGLRTGRNRGIIISGDQLPDRLSERLERAAAYWKDRP